MAGSWLGRRGLIAAAAAAVTLGVIVLAVAWTQQQTPPQPPETSSAAAASESRPTPPAGGRPSETPSMRDVAVPLPVQVAIPSIGVDSPLQHLGLAEDGTVALPGPGPHYDQAAWFTGSPRPGQVGPAVIEGHVDSAENGPSVFFKLGALSPGDAVTVTGQNGSKVAFVVDKVRRYAKDDFPTSDVYGNTARPELRLITCGGSFDSSRGHYQDNIVVYAHQVDQ